MILLTDANGNPDKNYGHQLEQIATEEQSAEGLLRIDYTYRFGIYPDGQQYTLQVPHYSLIQLSRGPVDQKTIISVRTAPQLAGVGLIAAIDEQQLFPHVHANDEPNSLPPAMLMTRSTSTQGGRFGWRATAPTIEHQISAALERDMGVNPTVGISRRDFDDLVFYMQNLAVPAMRFTAPGWEGKRLFFTARCDRCHRESIEISPWASRPAITIRPYSDFMLHNMGNDLGDVSVDGNSIVSEWRTAPLWGLGLVHELNPDAGFLHDGRATTIEHAILWHGGEARDSRNAFVSMTHDQREQLIKFLMAL